MPNRPNPYEQEIDDDEDELEESEEYIDDEPDDDDQEAYERYMDRENDRLMDWIGGYQ